jgi:uncharacterized alpha-E superfamily protein
VLSRIAESLFWIGRYVERADDTARILDVHMQMLLEDTYLDESTACRAVLSVMGTEAPEGTINRSLVLEKLAYDATTPSAIVGAIGSARENARRARETVSTELWECLNTTYIGLPAARMRATTPHHFFAWVRERAALVAGITDSTVSRDDAWHFLVLGRSIERADMTARLVATTSAIATAQTSWTTLLRSCGAYESYVRTYRGVDTDERAAEFLLLDRLFPRSVLYALTKAEESLGRLSPANDRVGVSDRARRALGRARTGLEYRPLSEIIDDLSEEMEEVQRACSAASDAVARRYFPRTVTTAWLEEVS